MFNLKCCVKGMLFYLAMSESQGCVGSLCPWSLTSKLRNDSDLNQGNLKLCLTIGGFFSMFVFLTFWFYELISKLQGLGERMWSVSLSSCTRVSGGYLFPSSTAHSISRGKLKRLCSSHSKGKEELLKYNVVLLFVKGRIHFVTKTAGGSIILV